MSTLFYEDPQLVIALEKKVVFVNPNDLQIFKEVDIPDDLSHELNKEASENDKPDQEKQTHDSAAGEYKIQNVCLSPDQQHLAIATAGQKALLIYLCRPEHAKLVSVRSIARTSSALRFCSDSKSLLVVDKSGDCYQYDCVDLKAKPRLLLGHLSIVYDLLWTRDSKYIITCDRDDKIRITNYPDTFDIHGYCLGHKEFVSGLAFIEEPVFVSVSGDGTLRLWDFLNCKQLLQFQLPAPGLKICLRHVGANQYQAAVLLHQENEPIGVYAITKMTTDDWEIREEKLLSFPTIQQVLNLCFVKDRLYVAGATNEKFTLCIAKIDADTAEAPENWLSMVEEQFESFKWSPEDISVWFKRRYDNVSEYLERKKRRIEEKQK